MIDRELETLRAERERIIHELGGLESQALIEDVSMRITELRAEARRSADAKQRAEAKRGGQPSP